MDLAHCSINTKTVPSLGLQEVVDATLARGVPAIAPWRDIIDPLGDAEAGRILSRSGLRVTSLCRGGMFPAADDAGRRAAIEDNLRAIDTAHAIGADCLVLVCGPIVGRDLAGSRSMVRDGIAAIVPHAAAAGVPLGIEPLHPMMVAGRSVINTLEQASALADELASPQLGIVLDVYHVWWDPFLDREIQRATGRVLGVHVSDWVVPIVDELASRGMMGDGCIDLPRVVGLARSAGYAGPVEIEVLSTAWWARPADDVLDVACARFEACV
jgi:sugar phosphate isomerase/epimerase